MTEETKAYRIPVAARRWIRNSLGIVALVGLQVLGVRSFYYTAGDSGQFLSAFVLTLSMCVGVLLSILGWRSAGISVVGLCSLAVLTLALWYSHLWVRLHLEAPRAVSYSYGVKLRTGAYPSDLSGYTFRDPLLRKHLQGFERRGDGFILSFFVATPSVSYWYDSATGWSYYPD